MDTNMDDYKKIFNKIADCIIVIDLYGIIVKINKTTKKLFGYDEEELIGKNVNILMPAPHKSKHDDYIKIYNSTKKKNIVDTIRGLRAIRKDGSIFPIELSVSELGENNFLGIIRDMTVMDSIINPMITINNKGIMLKVNNKVEEMFGYRSEYLIGKSVNMLMEEPHKSFHDNYVKKYNNNSGSKITEAMREVIGIRNDKTKISIEITVYRLSETIFVGIIRDLTQTKNYVELKKTLSKLEEVNKKLNESIKIINKEQEEKIKLVESVSRAKTSFIANMSHEIRTPMNGIFGMLALLNDTELDAIQKNYADICLKSAESLLSILDDILFFSKADTNSIELESIPFNLNTLVEDVISIMSSNITLKQKLDLVSYVKDDVPHNVIGDPSRLRQILMNLVGNAVKFTEIGEIAVEVSLIKNKPLTIEFAVIDTGIGISEKQQEKLFKPFIQADESTTRKFGGSGLGLAICKQLVELFNGNISVSSRLGRGSIFTFTIQLLRDSITDNMYNLNNNDLDLIKGLKICIIDDNATNCIALVGLFKNLGCDVDSFRSGEEGINKIKLAIRRNDPFDLLLLDYHMPYMDGIQVAEKLDKYGIDIHIIALSSSINHKKLLAQENIHTFTTKPIRKEQLLKLICHSILKKSIANTKPNTNPITNKHNLQSDANSKLNTQKSINSENTSTILIVEDNEVNLTTLSCILESHGHKLFTARNGLEAIEQTEKYYNDIDLILMDIHMPLMDGIEATKLIKNKGFNMPIIALTADITLETRETCKKIGIAKYLNKPVNYKALLDILKNINNKNNNKEKEKEKEKENENKNKNSQYIILIVDDIDTNILILTEFLKKIDDTYEIITANNGMDALDKIQHSEINLIFMDVKMSVMDGITATKEIRKIYGNRHIIIGLTAYNDNVECDQCIKAGMNDVLKKPLQFSDLKITINKYCDRKSKSENENLFDDTILNKIANNNKDFIKYILIKWNETVIKSLKDMDDAIKIKNYHEIMELAHSIKGSSMQVGTNETAKIAQIIELYIRDKEQNNDTIDYDYLYSLIVQLNDITTKTIKRINKYCE